VHNPVAPYRPLDGRLGASEPGRNLVHSQSALSQLGQQLGIDVIPGFADLNVEPVKVAPDGARMKPGLLGDLWTVIRFFW
jgi:hypothetical protein